LRRNRESPAETRPDIGALTEIYTRQFLELTPLRRHILSHLPLRSWECIVEPGCGTGLLAAELSELTSASFYTGIDTDERALALAVKRTSGTGEFRFVCADALEFVPAADAYVSSFFLATVGDPVAWLRKVRRVLPEGGHYAVFGEYDYGSIVEEPESGLADALRESFGADGFSACLGGEMNGVFEEAGFTVAASGSVQGPLQEPDHGFLGLQLGCTAAHPLDLPVNFRMSWSIVWGIYTRQAG